MLCKLLLVCTKDDIRIMIWPLYSETFSFVCMEKKKWHWMLQNSRRKLTRNIPGKMIRNQLLPGTLWFINWNLIFNCTGLFLPTNTAYWLFASWRERTPVVVLERSLQYVCSVSAAFLWTITNENFIFILSVYLLNFTVGGIFWSVTFFCDFI